MKRLAAFALATTALVATSTLADAQAGLKHASPELMAVTRDNFYDVVVPLAKARAPWSCTISPATLPTPGTMA